MSFRFYSTVSGTSISSTKALHNHLFRYKIWAKCRHAAIDETAKKFYQFKIERPNEQTSPGPIL